MVVGMRVDATSYEDAIGRVMTWAAGNESRAVAIATVNNVMEAHDDPTFASVMAACDLVTPDGMPLVWALRALGIQRPTRVYGPELTPKLLARAARDGVPVGFYGGTEGVLAALRARLDRELPSLQVVYVHAPPFRPLTTEEDAEVVDAIVASGCRILFVGIGCPKQERWIVEHRSDVPAVMLGVGAAFDFYAGQKRQAPGWMQRNGLEWVFRLATEPRRLWKRYLRHNPRFVVLFAAQLARTSVQRRRTTERRTQRKESRG
jgi:N-acetylglucosaminyldiphosphoundecaprenol N-acetyl-beta-D-mannosaminyltransferase